MKTIPLTDLTLLAKCLGMTASAVDPEALAAVRKANTILAKHHFTWDELLRKQVGVLQSTNDLGVGYDDEPYEEDVAERFNRDKPVAQLSIDDAFSYMRDRDVGSFRGFLTSVEKFYRERGYLTRAQRQSLFKAVMAEKKKDGR